MSRRVLVVSAAVVAVAAVVWLTWPTFARDDRPDVLVVADGFIAGGQRSFELRAREDGRSIRWLAFDDGWCDDPSGLARAVDDVDPRQVVLSFDGPVSCASAIAAAADGRDPVAVAQPGVGPDPAALELAGFTVVDPTPLVGRPDEDPRRPCEWWETCDGDGRIAVRDQSGALTQDGQERVARMLVAAL